MATTITLEEKVIDSNRIAKAVTTYCDHCSKEFDIRNMVKSSYGGVYCSVTCKNLYTED